MSDIIKCPACLNTEGGSCRLVRGGPHREATEIHCSICGKYQLTKDAFFNLGNGDENLEYMQPDRKETVILSHNIRTMSSNSEDSVVVITKSMLETWRSNGKLTSPAIQANNLIIFVGNSISESGEEISIIPDNIHAIIGSSSRKFALELVKELQELELIRCNPNGASGSVGNNPIPISIPTSINLSLSGWERYEALKRGEVSENRGFIAMKFEDPDLDPFVKDVVKPAVKEIGYDLVDMRDVARAGVIDNIMRAQIRDSTFVIVDLTHDNSGAYWEAGYAEGLGKPVVYICERTKFKEASTHFDTNHCTTVPWSSDDPNGFRRELIATLRRSLDLN